MPTNSEDKIVRRRAVEIRRPSAERLAEIEAIPDEAIDTSDIPELAGSQRLYRDANGRLPRRGGVIRERIAGAMSDRKMTNYALWKAAKEHCPTITETAIGQFLKGQRSIGIEYLEAIMAVLGLEISRTSQPGKNNSELFGEMTEDEREWLENYRAERVAAGWPGIKCLDGLSMDETAALLDRRSQRDALKSASMAG